MGTRYEYEFLKDTDPKQLCVQLAKQDDWEPVGFSIAPSSGEYVVLVRRKVPPPPEVILDKDRFEARELLGI